MDIVTPVDTSFTVYDKETMQYVPAIGQNHEARGDFFNDPVRIVVPNAKSSRTPMPGTGNRVFKRGH